MDVFQHINHARMVTLIEEARIPWLFDERPTAPLRDGCVVVDLHVSTRRSCATTRGPIEVLMYLEKLRSVDFVVGYEVRAAGADPASSPRSSRRRSSRRSTSPPSAHGG